MDQRRLIAPYIGKLTLFCAFAAIFEITWW